MVDAPNMDVSSTFIRESIRNKNKKAVVSLLPEKVWQYVDDYHLYEK